MSVPNQKIESTLRRAVQDVLGRGLNDPRIRGMVSVTGLRLSNDLSDATILISVAPAEHEELTMHGLRAASAHIRSEVMRRVRMRRVPRFSFRLDSALKNQAAVLDAIRASLPDDAPSDAPSSEDQETNP